MPHKIITKRKSDILNSVFIRVFIPKHSVNAPQNGRKKVLVKSSFDPLIFTSLLVFKTQVKKFEKYIIPIKA